MTTMTTVMIIMMIKDVDGDTNDIEANKADDDDGTYDADNEANTGSVSHSHMHVAHTTLSLLLVTLPEIFLYVDFDY